MYTYSESEKCSNILLFHYIKTATYKGWAPKLVRNVLQKIIRNLRKRNLWVSDLRGLSVYMKGQRQSSCRSESVWLGIMADFISSSLLAHNEQQAELWPPETFLISRLGTSRRTPKLPRDETYWGYSVACRPFINYVFGDFGITEDPSLLNVLGLLLNQ